MSTLQVHLRNVRRARGLSQQALAHRVGVSRQAINSIEAGRQIPSTALALTLARALSCDVEALFALPAVDDALTVAVDEGIVPGARIQLGRIDGDWVGHAAGYSAPADGVVVAVTPQGRAKVESLVDPAAVENTLLVAGCAPLLGIVAARATTPDLRVLWLPSNSAQALRLLAQGRVHMAGLHAVSDNAAVASRALPTTEFALVHLTRWSQGLVSAPDNPLQAVDELRRPGLRVVRRQPGAGAQRLAETALRNAGIAPSEVAGPLAAGHHEVGRFIAAGVADAGFAIEHVASALGLGFVPLASERFDLVVPTHRLGTSQVDRFLAALSARSFRAEAASLPGYDARDAGDITMFGSGPSCPEAIA